MKIFYMIDHAASTSVKIDDIVKYGTIAKNKYGVVWTEYDIVKGHHANITFEGIA